MNISEPQTETAFEFFDNTPRRFTEVWKCGGGRQSAAILALIIQGKLPKPDIAAIADTGRENSSTWVYLDNVLQPAAEACGIEIVRIPKEVYATVDLWGGADGETLLIPAYTTENGKVGKLSNFCTNEWKTRIVDRWLAEQGVVSNVRKWLGFSVDEPKRYLKHAANDFIRTPLVELNVTKPGCFALVREMGWPPPIHSSCWMCPNKSDTEWIDERDNRPEDFAKAVALDQEIRIRDPHAWLHPSCTPLSNVTLDPARDKELPCDSGNCFT